MGLLIVALAGGLIYLMLKVLISGAEKVNRDAKAAEDEAYYNDPDVGKKYQSKAISLGMDESNTKKLVYWEDGSYPLEMYIWRSYDYLYLFPTGHVSPYLRKPKKANEVKATMIPLDNIKLKRSAQFCLLENNEKKWCFDLSSYELFNDYLSKYEQEQSKSSKKGYHFEDSDDTGFGY